MFQYKFTPRMERIMLLSKELANPDPVKPVHIFIGASIEGTGVCEELYSYLTRIVGADFRSKILEAEINCEERDFNSVTVIESGISYDTQFILKKAHEKMLHYKQLYINEGHVLASILRQCEIPYITEEMKADIIAFTSVPRDLTVKLADLNFDKFLDKDVEIRRMKKEDYDNLCQFVLAEFGIRWTQAIDNGVKQEKIPIIMAMLNGEVMGFSCYDVVGNKKCIFGPMGTAKSERGKGIGRALLHQSLRYMKQRGYEYAIISQAGPIEFYELNCDAKLIPLSI
ncbi:GNAT family N-acetyltransferase [Bacillus sp. BGMRC 2118]|nr:GNAT family N-acetyltransferase [Bacillus sp. BGMRC 2118]